MCLDGTKQTALFFAPSDTIGGLGFDLQPKSALQAVAGVPDWLPTQVHRYLLHTESGIGIRDLARRETCHASTILRQIRRIETRRDDPALDRALLRLGPLYRSTPDAQSRKETSEMGHLAVQKDQIPLPVDLDREALRVLRRLGETGAVLAVADGMDTAVVVRESQDGSTTRSLSVSADYVQSFVLCGWIECTRPGRISRYTLSNAGRGKLTELMGKSHKSVEGEREGGAVRRGRYGMNETPVASLARRRDKDGTPFLTEAFLRAAERLREDFELAQMGPRVTQNWESFLTAGTKGGSFGRGTGPGEAQSRVKAALRHLGPGLGDVALRCCCYLEGLESAEKEMGWAARSGKIVLRIALQRLSMFYENEVGDVLVG